MQVFQTFLGFGVVPRLKTKEQTSELAISHLPTGWLWFGFRVYRFKFRVRFGFIGFMRFRAFGLWIYELSGASAGSAWVRKP